MVGNIAYNSVFNTVNSIYFNGVAKDNNTSKTDDALSPYRKGLRSFREKDGSLFELLPLENIPEITRKKLLKIIKSGNLSTEKFLNIVRAQNRHITKGDEGHKVVFGVAEECVDVLSLAAVKFTNELEIISKKTFEKFKNDVQDKGLLARNDADSFKQINDLALKYAERIPKENKRAIKESLSDGQQTISDKTLDNFFARLFCNYAVWTYQSEQHLENKNHRKKIAYNDPKEIQAMLEGEILEYDEKLPSDKLPEGINNITSNNPAKARNLIKGIIQIGKNNLDGAEGFTLENIIKFYNTKMESRTELFHARPDGTYDELKQQAKAWERIFEADIFLHDYNGISVQSSNMTPFTGNTPFTYGNLIYKYNSSKNTA
jgi:hypothetical protein